jgi:hypothetical protein
MRSVGVAQEIENITAWHIASTDKRKKSSDAAHKINDIGNRIVEPVVNKIW